MNNNSNQNQFYSSILGSDILPPQMKNEIQKNIFNGTSYNNQLNNKESNSSSTNIVEGNNNIDNMMNNNNIMDNNNGYGNNNMNSSIDRDFGGCESINDNNDFINGNMNMNNNGIEKGYNNIGNSSMKNNPSTTQSIFSSSNMDMQNNGFSRERPIGAGHRYNSHSMNFLPSLNNPSLFNQNNSISSILNPSPWSNTSQEISSKINSSPALKNSSPFMGGISSSNANPSMYSSNVKSPLMDFTNNSGNNLVKSLEYLSLDNMIEKKKMNNTNATPNSTSIFDNYQSTLENEDRGFNQMMMGGNVGGNTMSNTINSNFNSSLYNGLYDNSNMLKSNNFNENMNNVNELSQILKSINNNSMSESSDQYLHSYHSRHFSSPMIDGLHSFNDEKPSSVISNSSNTSSNNNFSPFNMPLGMNASNEQGVNDVFKNKFPFMEEPKSQNILAMNVMSGNKSPFQRSAMLTHHPKSSSITQLEKFQVEKNNSKSPFLNISHRRVASLSVNGRKLENKIQMNLGSQEKSEIEDDDELTLNMSLSNLSNEVILSPSNSDSNDLDENEKSLIDNQNTLQIENLDSSLTSDDVKSVFEKYGEISLMKIINEKEMAIISYENSKDAITAKNEMNGKKLGKNEVQINYYNLNMNEGTTPTKSLWIGNIPPTISPSELEEKFAKYGPIESARMLTHKTCGFINFENIEDAIKAKEQMDGMDINGTNIKIGYAKVPFKTDSQDGESIKSATSTVNSEKEKLKQVDKSVENVKNTKSSQSSSKKELPQLTIPMTNDKSSSYSSDNGDEYFSTIPTLSDHLTKRQVDQNRLREMRKKIEGHTTAKEIESFFNTIMLDVVGLCTDYIGNVIVQKVLDRTSDANRMKLIEKLSPHIATVGIHKNGTWVVQKIIDEAKGPVQMQYIVNGLKKYAPPLLLDQFGNYVIQCCLKLGTQNNQFIFDAISAKCAEIGPGRFGARAIRACLESQHTTKRQQKQVAMAIVQCSAELCVNPNGALLITWLLDTSSLPGRFRVIAPKLVPNIATYCCNKLASSTILKLVNQRIELDARNTIIKSIFYQDDSVLKEILSNPAYGVSVIQKILASACVNNEEKINFADRIRTVLAQMNDIKPNQVGYKRLYEELGIIPTTMGTINTSSFYNTPIDIVSPLTPTTPMSSFFSNIPNPSEQTHSVVSSSNVNINEGSNNINSSYGDSIAHYQQQQQQQQQQQTSLEGYDYQNPYYSLINNSPSLKFNQLQGYGNGIFNNSSSTSVQDSNTQFNNMYSNKSFYQQSITQKQQQQQQQQINPYSLLMNSVSSLSYYPYGSQASSSPTMSPGTIKAMKVSSPPSSPSLSLNIPFNNSYETNAQISSSQASTIKNNQGNSNVSSTNKPTPKLSKIHIPPSPPQSLSIGTTSLS